MLSNIHWVAAVAWLDARLLAAKLLERAELLTACTLEILVCATLLLAGVELPGTKMTTLEVLELAGALREEDTELAADETTLLAALLAALLLGPGTGEVDSSVAVVTKNLLLTSPIVSVASAAALGVDGALILTWTI